MKKLINPAEFLELAKEAGLGNRSANWARRVIRRYGLGKQIAGRLYADPDRAVQFLSVDAVDSDVSKAA